MAASQTIETYQLGIAQNTTSDKGATSNAKNSDDFKNIFDDINQNYSSDDKTKTTPQQSVKQASQSDKSQTNQTSANSTESKTVAQTNNETSATPSGNEAVTNTNEIEPKTEVTGEQKTVQNTNTSTQETEANIKAEAPLPQQTSDITQQINLAAQSETTIAKNTEQKQPEVLPEVQPKVHAEIAQNTDTNINTKNVEDTQEKSESINMDIKTILNENPQIQELMQTNTTVKDLKNNLTELSNELKKTLNKTLEAKGMTQEEALKEDPSSVADLVQSITELDGIIKTLDESQTPTEQIDITQNNASSINASTSSMPITIAPETLDWVSKISLDSGENNFPQSVPVINLENVANAKTNVATDVTQPTNVNDMAAQINQNNTAATMPTLNTQDTQQQSLLAEAATDVLPNSNLSNNKNTDSTASKNPLTQEMLDNMDTKITSVKTSTSSNQSSNQNSNQQGFSPQQNVQEQTIKLELQNNATTTVANADATTNIDNIQQDVSSVTNLSSTTQVQNSSIATQKELTNSNIMEQINKQLDAKTLQDSQNNATTRISIVLRPENLGKIELELINSKDGLIAKMTTDNAQIKDFLDKNLNGLKETMVAQGVNVNNVSIKVNETQAEDTTFSFEKQANQENSQQQTKNSNSENGLAEDSDKITNIDGTNENETENKIGTNQNTTKVINDYKTYNERGRIL